MGFGSGGGGFTPSPNNVPGSTTAGTDKDTDTHQFTGSVDITGSLTLNGSSITGGGGGGTPGGSDTQIQYNNGGAFGGASGLIYDDINNRVGIGVADPDSKIEILSTTTQQKWSYDADSFATLAVADNSEVTVATGEAGNLILDAGGDIRLNAAGGDISFRENAEVKLIFDMDTAGGTTKIYSGVAGDDLIFGTAPGGAGNVLTIKDDGKVGIGTGTPLQTLSVSGSAAFSGTYGSTAIETRDTNLQTLSATDGVAIINLTSAAVNTSFTFLIDNGTYTGQEKIVYFKTIIGADGANSNDATLQGTNIDSPLGNATGLLGLSGSDDGSGFVGYNRGAARLLWDGTDWAPISVTNLNWN